MFCGETLSDSSSFNKHAIVDDAQLEVIFASAEDMSQAERYRPHTPSCADVDWGVRRASMDTSEYIQRRVQIRYTSTKAIMIFCFVTGAIIASGRLAAGFSVSDTGWKSFSVAAGFVLIGCTATIVHEKSDDVENYLGPAESDDSPDASLIQWTTRLARMMLVAYALFMVFAWYCIYTIPDEIDRACHGLDPCLFRQYLGSTQMICAVLVLLSKPVLFLLLVSEAHACCW